MENIEDCAPVTIAIRKRPFLATEIAKGCLELNTEYDRENKVNVYIDTHLETLFTLWLLLLKIFVVEGRPFVFDHVLDPDSGLEDIYNEIIRPLVSKTLDGFSCTAFAYGQTGTGKTYTMGLHNNVSILFNFNRYNFQNMIIRF